MSEEKLSRNDKIRKALAEEEELVECPACKAMVPAGSKICPKCGFSGYLPMAPSKLKKIKSITYPVFIILTIIILLIKFDLI